MPLSDGCLAVTSSFQALFAPADDLPAALLTLPFIGQDCYVAADGAALSGTDLAQLPAGEWRLMLGEVDGQPCLLRHWPAGTGVPAGWQKRDYRQLWAAWPAAWLAALARAKGLLAWRQQHRFCGVCGQSMHMRREEPAMHCPACGHLAYPRIAPVCIGLVLRGEEILLGRSPHFAPGVYSALAGYVEAGESIEACLHREIREEAGIEITNLRWFASQSWPYPHSLMFGFFADYLSGELCPQPGEIEDLQWFKADALPVLPHASSIAYQMIQEVLAGGGR